MLCINQLGGLYLEISLGLLSLTQSNTRLGWKRRWGIIRDDVLMFFEMKQDAIKQGWLKKKSSGTGTLGRCVCVCVEGCTWSMHVHV